MFESVAVNKRHIAADNNHDLRLTAHLFGGTIIAAFICVLDRIWSCARRAARVHVSVHLVVAHPDLRVVHRTGVNGERCHLAREGLVDRGPIRFADVAICPRRDVGLDTVRVTWPAALGLNHLAVDVECHRVFSHGRSDVVPPSNTECERRTAPDARSARPPLDPK